MWTKVSEFIGTLLAKLGIEWFKYRREELKESDRNKALKAALEIERKANEMDGDTKYDDLGNWVRKDK